MDMQADRSLVEIISLAVAIVSFKPYHLIVKELKFTYIIFHTVVDLSCQFYYFNNRRCLLHLVVPVTGCIITH